MAAKREFRSKLSSRHKLVSKREEVKEKKLELEYDKNSMQIEISQMENSRRMMLEGKM